MVDERLEMFTRRYTAQETPWDTGITPPEIVAIAAELPAGKALDLGCGTGTNVRYLLERGWEADGIDFVPQAIEMAQAKLADFPPERFTVLTYDVTRLGECDQLRAPYTLVIDIGCGHGLPPEAHEPYARDINALLAPGGVLMLFAHEPTAERAFGWTRADVERLFTPYLDLVWQEHNADTTTGVPSGWYRLVKRG